MTFVVASTVLHPILRAAEQPARVVAVLPSAVYLRVGDAQREPGPPFTEPGVTERDPDRRPAADQEPRPASMAGIATSPAIVALLARDAVRVPVGMVVALPRQAAPFAALEPDCTGTIGAGSLSVGGMRYQPLRYWDPRVPQLRAALTSTAAVRRCGAIAALTDQLPSDLDAALEAAVAPLVCALRDATPRPPALAVAVRTLIGLGPGLTPAGDDVLAGALLALAAAGDLPRYRRLAAAVTGLLDRTGPLSGALLDQACRGRAIPEVTGLLRALAGAGDLDAALVALSLVGHTSGPALALGVQLAVRARAGCSLGRAA